jgi:hypothetical protein
MNLLFDKWIPVLGAKEPIAPWEITDNGCEIKGVKSVRPDFDAALLCFLIGVYQFAYFEPNEGKWAERFFSPPLPDEIKTRFKELEIETAFEFFGENSRFMQEPVNSFPKDGIQIGITQLLLDYPQRKKITDGEDLLIKHEIGRKMCLSCCAAALYLMQSFTAYGGGKGCYRCSLHVGAPITTFLIGSNLWETVWLNVLSAEKAPIKTPPQYVDKSDVFPWTKESLSKWVGEGKPGRYYMADSAEDFFHVYWGMPRRLRVGDFEKGTCFLCGKQGQTVSDLRITTFGISYEEYWPHPVVPKQVFRKSEETESEAEEVESETISAEHIQEKNKSLIGQNVRNYTYLEWLGLALADWGNDKIFVRPASIVSAYIGSRADEINSAVSFSNKTNTQNVSLWVAGYDFDTKKQRCNDFINSKVPIVAVRSEIDTENAHELFELAARGIANDARLVLYGLHKQLRDIAGMELSDKKVKQLAKDDAVYRSTREFTSLTEARFFSLIKAAAANPIEYGCDWDNHEARCGADGWRKYLAKQAVRLFDSIVDVMQLSKPKDVVKAVKARNNVERLGTIKRGNKRKAK